MGKNEKMEPCGKPMAMVHLEKNSMTYREESSHLGIRNTKETALQGHTMRRQGNTMQEQEGLQGRM